MRLSQTCGKLRLNRHLSATVRQLEVRRYASVAAGGAAVPYDTSLASKNVAGPVSLPSQADVVIIGGGSLGCQTLYHLAKQGVTSALLLEKHALTAGTTWHTAGLVWSLRPSDTTIHLLRHMTELMPRLERESQMNVGWINNGGLFVANNRQRLQEYQRLRTVGQAMGVESYMLAPNEVHQVHPLLNTSDMYGCLYSPADGTIDPAGLCSALSRASTRLGAQVIEGCRVDDIETEDTDGYKRVQAVVTPYGRIRTRRVVNAAGVWGNAVARMAGVQIPLLAMKHAYVVSERIANIAGTPNVRDHDASVYLKLQGDALSIGGYEHNPIILDQEVGQDFAFGLYDLDWDVFGCHIDGAVHRMPALQHTGIKSTVCGPESFTPDHNAIMGEDPRVRGLYHCCGFNSSGMMLGGGCGWQMAEWLIHGRPTLDMSSYDIRRFHPALASDSRWVRERSHESYVKNYSVVFPHDEPLAGRNRRKDPLYDELLQLGCVYQERQGWERPGWFHRGPAPAPALDYNWYGAYGHPPQTSYPYLDCLKQDYSFDFADNLDTIRSECLSCRHAAALFNMSYFGKFYIAGPDAQRAVDWIFSNDLHKPPGSVVYTCMLNRHGGIEADLTVTVLERGEGGVCDPEFQGRAFYVAVGGGFAEHVRAHIVTAIQDKQFKAQLTDCSEKMGLLSLQGPLSRTILQSLTDTDLGDVQFPFGTSRLVTVAGVRCRAIRLSFVGELGWELHAASDTLLQLYRALKRAGAAHGLVDAGYRAMDSLSAEKGYKHWHGEIRADDAPQEAGLLFTCKLHTDVEFEGRRAVEALKSAGITRRLVTLTTAGLPSGGGGGGGGGVAEALWGLETILCNNTVCGHLRRAEPAFYLDKMIAYGYVCVPTEQQQQQQQQQQQREGDGAAGGGGSSGRDQRVTITKTWLQQQSWSVNAMGTVIPVDVHVQHPFDPKSSRLMGVYNSQTASWQSDS